MFVTRHDVVRSTGGTVPIETLGAFTVGALREPFMDDVPDRIEHTVLGPTTQWADVEAVLETAADYGMRACIPSCYVARAARWNEGRADGAAVSLVTVVDFPHGQGATEARCGAAKVAWADGAAELDVVVNLGRLRAGEDRRVQEDLEELVASVPVPVKLIVEAPLLDDAALHRVGELAAAADVAYLKTATGFADGGATVDAVEILAEYLPVKASGGIGSWERANAMFDAGAERIGASSGDVIVREWREQRG